MLLLCNRLLTHIACDWRASQLTAQRRAPPLQHDAGLPAAAGVGLQRVAQTLVGVGPAGAQVVHAGTVPGLRRHHAVAGLEGGRLQHLAAGVSALPRLVTGVFAGVDVLSRTAGRSRVASVFNLKCKTVRVGEKNDTWRDLFCVSWLLTVHDKMKCVILEISKKKQWHQVVTVYIAVSINFSLPLLILASELQWPKHWIPRPRPTSSSSLVYSKSFHPN